MVSENVNLPDRQAEFIRKSIDSGRYENASEVVRAGLNLLEEWLAEEQPKKSKLRAMLNEAKDGGLSDSTPEEIWSASEDRHQPGNA